VYGYASATTSANYGVVGRSNSPSGTGVRSDGSASTGTNYGVYPHSNSPNGKGVFGYESASTGYNHGIYGQSDSTSGHGVEGHASATTSVAIGVAGASSSPDGESLFCVGGLTGIGAKSAIVDTQDDGRRAPYAVESPQNWYDDFGHASLDRRPGDCLH
jgi:hypothetical protein